MPDYDVTTWTVGDLRRELADVSDDAELLLYCSDGSFGVQRIVSSVDGGTVVLFAGTKWRIYSHEPLRRELNA